MIESFFLGSFLAYNCSLLALKMKYVKIENQTKQDILEKGLYHITSNESAEKIMKDGYIYPSGIISSLGAKKTFFFAGIPNLDLIRENVANTSEQFEWTAIKVSPDENDISNYRIRAYDDNSVVCKGKCNLENEKVKKVNLVLDLNQEGNPYIREKTQAEIDNGYIPNPKLQEKLRANNSLITIPKNLMKAYLKKPLQLLYKIKENIQRRKQAKENLKDISNVVEMKNEPKNSNERSWRKELKVDLSNGNVSKDIELKEKDNDNKNAVNYYKNSDDKEIE